MRVRVLKAVPAPSERYICLFCRLLSVEDRRGRRYQHTGPPPHNGADPNLTSKLTIVDDGLGAGNSNALGSASKIKDIIRSFMVNGASKEANAQHHVLSSQAGSEQPKSSLEPVHSKDETEAKQKVLQPKFAVQRRKQLLDAHVGDAAKTPEDNEATLESSQIPDASKAQPNQTTGRRSPKVQKLTSSRARRVQKRVHKQRPPKLKQSSQDSSVATDQLTSGNGSDNVDSEKGLEEPAQTIAEGRTASTASVKKEAPASKPAAAEPAAKVATGTAKRKRSSEKQPTKGKGRSTPLEKKSKAQSAEQGGNKKSKPSEKERKAQLAKKLIIRKTHPPLLTKYASKPSKDLDAKASNVEAGKSSSLSAVAGWKSLAGALGPGASKKQAPIERSEATKLEILPIKVEQPPVPNLAYGLERVLFNPGVYQLQDPRSRVYNFDPYLQKIMPVADFDFNALKEYITSSKDESLKAIAKEHRKRYVGSTSSMTAVLAHFHFLLSQWRPITTSMLSKSFPTNLSSFTELQRSPSAIFLRWKDGSYAIDADKEFAKANILSMLGKSMEKLLTLKSDDYEKYRKSGPGEVNKEEQLAPESYHYSTMGDFLMRSQLDAHDPRLPGTGMFDLKTRAVVSIRMDVTNYEHGLGYQIKSRQGEWESFEREYYDMIRAAFLKYSMQVRMGRMDGIFVAFHNIERVFGFQYISLPEMDSTIHGQWDTSLGDQEFKLGLDLLNKILDKATKKFPETSLRIHFETRDAATPFMYIFAEPVTEEQVAVIQTQNDAKIAEFERNILGLKRGVESAAQVSQEDDGKWDNIQASVQQAMDEDELSVDVPHQNQESSNEDIEESDMSTDQHSVPEAGPLSANGANATDKVLEAATASGDMDEVEHGDEVGIDQVSDPIVSDKADGIEEHGSVDNAQIPDQECEAQTENRGSDEDREHDNEQVPETEDSGRQDDEHTALEAAVEEESAVIDDAADRNLEPPESSPASGDSSKAPQLEISNKPDHGDNLDEGEATQGIHSAEKAAYQAPVPGEETPDYQTAADQPFLDTIDQETDQADSSLSAPSDVMAMTLTLRNKVNNEYVHRPMNFTDKDVWSIEYHLLEVPSQEKAKALYRACQARRKKALDDPELPEDADAISAYLANLRRLSKSGNAWRKAMDEEESGAPIQVLGNGSISRKGEGRLSDQDSDA